VAPRPRRLAFVRDLDELFSQLSREPDFDAPELQAFDATDRLLLETVRSCDIAHDLTAPGTVVTIGDRHGALTLGAIRVLGARDVRVFQDPLLAERALAANAEQLGLAGQFRNESLGPALLSGTSLVLLQLPKSLAELSEIADAVARFAPPDVVLLAGGRIKHMTLAMNDLLRTRFASVTAGLAQQKSRVLTARDPHPIAKLGDAPFPVWGEDRDLAFRLAATGATFGGAQLDHGSRLLLRTLEESAPRSAPSRILDLGCGNGVLATAAAMRWPDAEIIASDQSAGAVAATRLTADAAGVGPRVEVRRADATEAVSDHWADLILLNPPFHTGSTVHTGVAHRLIRSCRRALAPGGELRIVFNSSLRYRGFIERELGEAVELARDRTFTVLSVMAPMT